MSKTALIIVAHPDDEVIGVGGTILKLQKEYGYTVYVHVIGYAPHNTKWESLKRSSEILGFINDVNNKMFSPEPNRMDELGITTLVGYVTNLINRIKPEIVFTHHNGDTHQDHRAVSEAVLIATRPFPSQIVKKLYTFETAQTSSWSFGEFKNFEPNVYLDITRYFDTKVKALCAYSEEIALLDPRHPRSPSGIENTDAYMGFRVGLGKVESFKLVRSIDIL